MSLRRRRAFGSNLFRKTLRMMVAATNRMVTMVMGGTPAFRMVLEATNDRPQKSTVPQTASSAGARGGAWVPVGVSMVVSHATRTGRLGQQRAGVPDGRACSIFAPS